MANFWDELNAQAQQQAAQGANHSWDAYNAALQAQAPKKSAKKTKNFWLDQISTAGGILGGIGGSLLSPIAGTAAGAGAGSALGEAIENAIMGEDLGKNVLQEGALGAVFGAGPIKLAKGAVSGGMALAKGAGMSAAKEAATKAALTPLRQSIGKGVSNAAENLAVKQFRLTPSQLKNFKTKFGEDAGQVIRKYGFNNADDVVSKGIQPLQQQFDSTIAGITGVTKDSLKKSFESRISKLAGSAASDNRALASQLKKESAAVLKKYGDVIDANELNTIRKEFDSLVNYTNKAANPARYSINKRMADSIRETLQKSDTTGTLKNVGRELQKLRQLSDNVVQQEQLGKGSLPLGLSNLLGGAVGGGSLGGPGAVVGILMANAINSPTGRKVAMQGAEKLAGKLSAAKGGQSAGGIATRLGALGAVQGSLNQAPQTSSLEDALVAQDSLLNSANPSANPTMSAPPMNDQNIPPSYNQSPQPSNPFGISSDNLAQAMMLALVNNDTKSFGELKTLYDIVGTSEKANAAKTYNSAVSGTISDFQSSLDELDKMESTISSGSGGTLDPIIGTLRSMNPYDTQQQTLQAMINKTRQIVGKALEGGVLRKEDEEKYKKILPTVGDTTEVALNKIAMIKAQLQAKLQNYSSLVGNGENATDLTSALLQAGGAY